MFKGWRYCLPRTKPGLLFAISLCCVWIYHARDRGDRRGLVQLLRNCSADLCPIPFRNVDSKWRTAAKYRIATCVIEKTMSTVLVATTCYLHDSRAFIAANRTVTNDIYERRQAIRLCKDKNEFRSKRSMENSNDVDDSWLYFTVVRDPIDRFISGFVDKCQQDSNRQKVPNRCFGCQDDLECVVERLYRRVLIHSTGKRRVGSYDDIHFFPQTSHCDMAESFHRLRKIRFAPPNTSAYQQMVDEMVGLFRLQGVEEEKLALIRQESGQLTRPPRYQLHSGHTKHSTTSTQLRRQTEDQLNARPDLIATLVKTFYQDYKWFGFPLPNALWKT